MLYSIEGCTVNSTVVVLTTVNEMSSSVKIFVLFSHSFPESFLQQGQLGDEICDGVVDRLNWGVIGGCLHAKHKVVDQRVRHFVAGKQHLRIFQQLTEKFNRLVEQHWKICWISGYSLFQHVAEGVILLAHSEHRRVGHFSVSFHNDSEKQTKHVRRRYIVPLIN